MFKRLLIVNFLTVYRLDRWVKQRFTPAGTLVLGAFVATCVFSLDISQTFAYQMLALGFAILLVAIASALLFRGLFSVERRLPRFATVGEPFVYRLRVDNLAKRLQRGLLVSEQLRSRPPRYEELYSYQVGSGIRRLISRYLGYARWAWLIQRSSGAHSTERLLPDLAPGRGADIEMQLTPLRRGQLRLLGVRLARPDPLGIFKACILTPAPESLMVMPKRYPVAWVDLEGVPINRAGGPTPAATVGDSEEFVALREYRPRDPLRHIHWRSWARLGRPIVKEFQNESFTRQALVLDTFGSTPAIRRFEEAVSVAASFACAAPSDQGRLDLLFMGAKEYRFSAGRGLAPAECLLEALACVDICTSRPFSTLHDSLIAKAAHLSACVCVLLEWDSDRQALIEALRRRAVPVLVVVLRDAQADTVLDPGPMLDQPQRLLSLSVGCVEEGLAGAAPRSHAGTGAGTPAPGPHIAPGHSSAIG